MRDTFIWKNVFFFQLLDGERRKMRIFMKISTCHLELMAVLKGRGHAEEDFVRRKITR